MAKLTQLDKAIAGIDQEIAILQAARQRLIAQQARTPKRTTRAKALPGSAPTDRLSDSANRPS